ncbi:ribulokinase [Petroclostridium sp. X23]|uniref:ribulokinase n=1 Tax=Petroclostridium sp. X23 TaxID=3045146 RepID=UPI0024AD8B6B|nr:ribulokinase [Petroclostridium sp. X23]WHH56818.1 ribulokinase [Petroclostridium sp. X23]
MSKYSIGVDFGTLSARALIVDVLTGEEIATSVYEYSHGIIDTVLPSGKKLGIDWALQHPRDYIEALSVTVKEVIKLSQVSNEDIIGIGIDFTSCTILPVKANGIPLCMLSEFEDEPHAYVKLWKHHAAQYCADILNETALKMKEQWISLYGGKISSEWLVPKVMQIIKEAPEVYDAADKIIEAGDWLVWQMTGIEARSACNAGYKALWHHLNQYPSKKFFKALDPRLEDLVEKKLSNQIKPLGSCAGYIKDDIAVMTGLKPGTAVAVGIIDAHASVPACRIDGPGKMLMIMGTSTCHMLLSENEVGVPGTCGIVKGGILPGLFAYEAGQSCVGDHFSWFVENCLPISYYNDAKEKGINIYKYLQEKAEKLKVGESGLIALDWWNGVRSVLMDFDLSGILVGMTLQTKSEEIYRALIEATAYGTRQIIEAFESAGVFVDELYAAGGIASKDPMTMQIYSDICNRDIKISGSSQSGALGSAIYGAIAAGSEKSGFKDLGDAIRRMGKIKDTVYKPIAENVEIYNMLFKEYKILHDYFGRSENNVMKNLKAIKYMKLNG